MNKNFKVFILLIVVLTFSGCNIVPKSVVYQKEEEKLIGTTDIVNPVVEEIQVVLAGFGYDTGNKDGRMGQKTRDAIKEFQESIGIKSTGYVNKLTLTQIEDIRRTNEERSMKKEYDVEVRSAYSEDKTSEFQPTTKDIQTALKNAGFDPGTIDGKMGQRTKQAVMEFQKTKGLKVDGKVGSQTWSALEKYLKR
ncbi:MAG: peptidoglycan-binding protein [Candidatus Omnitrophota bacterium]